MKALPEEMQKKRKKKMMKNENEDIEINHINIGGFWRPRAVSEAHFKGFGVGSTCCIQKGHVLFRV